MNNLMKPSPFLFASLLAVPISCLACATVSDDLEDAIKTTGESALIVWNSKTRVEQFVRRANFQTKSKDFGFLVPTPTKPQLSANRDALFDDLEAELLPKKKVVTQRGLIFKPLLPELFRITKVKNTFSKASDSMNTTDDTKGVEVVAQKRVGGYNASILRASDTASLTKWLRAHRYAVSSDTREWLAAYVKQGFYITAFQIASDAGGGAHAKAVRLTFKTDAPFYPYRETKRQSAQSLNSDGMRILRVFYVGETRVEGRIEDGAQSVLWSKAATVGDAEYSAPLQADKLRANGLDVPPGNLRLTAFADQSSPRNGWGDLKFSSSKDQREKTPPPNIIYKDKRVWVPLDVVALAGLGCVWMLRRRTSSKYAG